MPITLTIRVAAAGPGLKMLTYDTRQSATVRHLAAPMRSSRPSATTREWTQDATPISAAAAGPSFDFSRLPIHPPSIQCKTEVSSPHDPLEREADDVAGKVLRIADPGPISSCAGTGQCQCAACREGHKDKIHARRAPSVNDEASLDTGAALQAAKVGGVPLAPATRDFFEPRFGHDFSRVRVHADGDAADGARAVRAQAYTVGSDIVFARGQYAPGTHKGRRLIAHELAHVAQQAGAGAASVQRQPAPDAGKGAGADQIPTVTVFVADPRKSKDVHFATRTGRADAARIRKARKLSTDDRQELNAKLRFFEAGAKAAYIQQIRPVLMQVAPEHPANEIEMPEEPASPRAQKQAAKELAQWKLEMLTKLAAMRAELEQIKKDDLPVLKKYAEDMQLAAQEAAELARVAEKRAAESRASARRWMRIAGVAKIALASLEAIVACPAAETGIGAVGCIHALSSYKSGWDEAWNAEPSPTVFHQAFKAAAKPFTSEKTAEMIGDLGDAAVGMGTSSYLGARPGAPPTVTGPAKAGAGAASADAEAIEETLKALGVAEGEGAQLSTGVKIWGEIFRGKVKLLTYLSLQGRRLTAGVLSSEIQKVAGKAVEEVAKEEQSNVVKAMFTFRQQSMKLARQVGADTLRVEGDVVMNPELRQSLIKAGFKEAPDDPSKFVKEELVK
jgi:Domain of unknown function (DUF4157)